MRLIATLLRAISSMYAAVASVAASRVLSLNHMYVPTSLVHEHLKVFHAHNIGTEKALQGRCARPHVVWWDSDHRVHS